jgi:hypothetical protein
MYWFVNTGTSEEPWLDHLVDRYRAWNEEHGDLQMFPFRQRDLDVGDVLIHRLVASPACELVAIAGPAPQTRASHGAQSLVISSSATHRATPSGYGAGRPSTMWLKPASSAAAMAVRVVAGWS